MVIVRVGTSNPQKVEASKRVFGLIFEAIEVGFVPVYLPAREVGTDEQTMQNAILRAKEALTSGAEVDFGVGIEGVINITSFGVFEYSWACVMRKDQVYGLGCSPRYQLPDDIINQVLAGMELSDVVDNIRGISGTKFKDGEIGFLTHGLLNRRHAFEDAIICACARFIRSDLFES